MPGSRCSAEPRPAGLIQSAEHRDPGMLIAVLEQPSPRRIAQKALGRRNIVLLQSNELNNLLNCVKFYLLASESATAGATLGAVRGWGSLGTVIDGSAIVVEDSLARPRGRHCAALRPLTSTFSLPMSRHALPPTPNRRTLGPHPQTASAAD